MSIPFGTVIQETTTTTTYTSGGTGIIGGGVSGFSTSIGGTGFTTGIGGGFNEVTSVGYIPGGSSVTTYETNYGTGVGGTTITSVGGSGLGVNEVGVITCLPPVTTGGIGGYGQTTTVYTSGNTGSFGTNISGGYNGTTTYTTGPITTGISGVGLGVGSGFGVGGTTITTTTVTQETTHHSY